MKGELYNPGQLLKKEDYDHAKYMTQDAISDRILDLFTPGILENSQEDGENLPFEITAAVGLFANVGTGVAIASGSVDSSDTTETGGERIYIPTADTVIGQNYRRTSGSGGTGTGPYKESEDGLGNWTPTPQSTLTRNIPLSDDTTNYIWIGYLHAIDPSVYSLHKASSAKIYPRGLDGYDIIVTTSASTPVFNGNANYHLLGTVTTVGGFITDIDQSGMVFAKTRESRVGIKIDSSKVPNTYTDGETKFLDDHINALGSGAGPTPENPHNQTIEDFGLLLKDVDLVEHRKQHHSKGIIAVAGGGSMLPQTDTTTPDSSPAAAMVFLKQLTAGEEIIVNGNLYTSAGLTAQKLLAPSGAGQVGDAYISFSTAPTDPAGLYYIWLEINGDELELKKATSFTDGANRFLMATANWDGSAFTDGTPNPTSDERVFGLTGTKDLQDDSISTPKYKDASVTGPKIANDTIVDANVNSAAGIQYSKLDLANSIVNADVAAGAAVEYAKLDLTGSIVEADFADDAVTSPKIDEWDGASLASDPNTGSGIATAHLKNGCVTANKLDTSLLAGISIWNKIVVTKDDFSYGVAQFSFPSATFLFPAKTVIEGVVIRHTEAFVSGAVYELAVGVSGFEDKFASWFEVQGPIGDTIFQASHQMAPENMGASFQVYVTARVDSGFLNAAASGEAEIYIKTSVLP